MKNKGGDNVSIKLEVWGDYALFSRPELAVERVSYDCITPSAARGVLEAIYWHPGMKWIVDKIYLLSPIRFTNIRRNEVKAKASGSKGFKNIFVNAPCVVCIAYDTTYDMAQIDCGLLGENIILAAWAKGIGSCCLGSSARWILDSPSAKPYLDRMAFSKNYKLLYCIALGYPDESPEAKPRRQDMIKFMD